MGQTTRTTKILLDFSGRSQGGANPGKREHLAATAELLKWQRSGKKKRKPGIPTAFNYPTLYAGTFTLELDALDVRKSFIRLKVYTGEAWVWVHYPTLYNRYFERRRAEPGWETESPKLILGKKSAAIHFLQSKTITAKKIVERRRDPDLVTAAVDLNVKQLAVITVRQHGVIKETRFVSDQGRGQHTYVTR